MKKNAVLVSAIASVALVLTGCSQSQAESEPAPTLTIQDSVTPGAEILVSSTCEGVSAKLETSWGENTTMSPAADKGELIAYVNAPDPLTGDETLTATCADGTTIMVNLLGDEN
ncbi:putative secreted protein [Corynebacterium kutscheri]|uniref:Secreted protein n=1 Tax=Corynebacterium kutscheri TaxID=35755 RepID=A0A0F6R224_9CORY|nr:hypothetical protein [Corynebacterium kutscheri]AKE42225.1 hypothetical protein UL82_10455 [Corynebacterium kutscheri]VEH05725.1 putative secreted protein [Corynebacterium kutscheri]VEH10568.1 putative secreted protein [Corynebacterium kutscheri]VEH81621.1 putative secreted protein [Corynebacterium kutscheri]